MNKTVILLFLIFLLNPLYAQFSKVRMSLTMMKDDKTQSITLNQENELAEEFEGYFLEHQYEKQNAGKMQKGGFSFANWDADFPFDQIKRQWAKNKFPVHDLEDITNGTDLKKVISFQIDPVFVDDSKDTVAVYFRYVIFNVKSPKAIALTSFDLNTKILRKSYRIPLDKEVALTFIDKEFEGYKFTLKLEKIEFYKLSYYHTSGYTSLISALGVSLKESVLTYPKIHFKLSFNKNEALNKKNNDFDRHFINTIIIDGLAKGEDVVYDTVSFSPNFSNTMNNVQIHIQNQGKCFYYTKIKMPFNLAVKEKTELYRKYKSYNGIFTSECEILIVPISFENGNLVVDFIMQYDKMNIGDGIERWTPVKKRISFNGSKMISIQLPKEFWTANFTRDGNKYDIYGYTDYERQVDEIITLEFN